MINSLCARRQSCTQHQKFHSCTRPHCGHVPRHPHGSRVPSELPPSPPPCMLQRRDREARLTTHGEINEVSKHIPPPCVSEGNNSSSGTTPTIQYGIVGAQNATHATPHNASTHKSATRHDLDKGQTARVSNECSATEVGDVRMCRFDTDEQPTSCVTTIESHQSSCWQVM